MGTFFHFFAHDEDGPIGNFLRNFVRSFANGALMLSMDDRTFAIVFVSLFMQVMGILRLPQFLGPSFSPFDTRSNWIDRLYQVVKTYPEEEKDINNAPVPRNESVNEALAGNRNKYPASEKGADMKKKRNKRKKKKQA